MNARDYINKILSVSHLESDDALDLIYDYINDLCYDNKFDECNFILSSLDVSGCSEVMLIAFLTTTLPAKSRISFRKEFYNRVEAELQNRKLPKEEITGLLRGLE